MKEEVTTKYWCHRCRSNVNNPIWRDVKENVKAAHCPQCNEEVARRLKAK